MQAILKQLSEQKTLTRVEAESAMNLLFTGAASNEQIAALLLGLRSRGETLDELVGFTSAMRSHAIPVTLPPSDNGTWALDIVGTGGDGTGTFNISTAAAFVCAGAGATVAKHGNRSVSSKCGSSDVLEALGVKTTLGKEGVEHCLKRAGMAFIFAPMFHPAMKHVMPVRRSLAVRTCFNILGPMCNPAGVQNYLIGAFSLEIAQTMIRILAALGGNHIFAVHSKDGLDEISISAPTTILQFNAGEFTEATISPSDYGLPFWPIDDVLGGDAQLNAGIIRRILSGKEGAPRDVVVLNAAFALVAAGVVSSVSEGISRAGNSIDSGAAQDVLGRLSDASHSFQETAGEVG